MTKATSFHDGRVILHGGDCLDVLDTLEENSVDSIVTDPPYHLVSIVKRFGKDGSAPAKNGTDGLYARASRGFMGKEWDGGDIAFRPETWVKVLRVLKPGGHLVAFSAPKCSHRMVCAIEDAGFEMRDGLMWMFGSGFPKSLSVDKATQKLVEARYGLAKCDCVDREDGRTSRHDVGCGNWQDVRVQRVASVTKAQALGDSVVSFNSDDGPDTLRDLRNADCSQVSRSSAIEEAFLLETLRERSSETAGHGHASLRAGMEEPARGNQREGQDLSDVWGTARNTGASRPSFETVSVRRDEPANKSRRPMRELPSQDREGDRANAGFDSDRGKPRRVVLDDCGGRGTAVARVCSWCGNPDREWLNSIVPLGSALKPAYEPICLARKPLSEPSIAANVLRWGTGALNIDACRIESDGGSPSAARRETSRRTGNAPVTGRSAKEADAAGKIWNRSSPDVYMAERPSEELGRWPANLVLSYPEDEYELRSDIMPEQKRELFRWLHENA